MDKSEQINAQQTVFAKWFNNKLKKVFQPTIDTLINGFKSGRRFYSISNVLCEKENLEIPEELSDSQLVSAGIENILAKFQMSLPDSLQSKVDELFHASEADLTNLAWWMISGYFSRIEFLEIQDVHDDTLLWCQQCVKGYRGVNISNFTNSWRDGCALLAIIHFHRSSLFDFESRLSKTPGQNLTLALHLANQEFACAPILEMDNFTCSEILDWKCICLFLMELRLCIHRNSKIQITNSPTSKDENGNLKSDNPSFESMVNHFQTEFSSTLQIMDTIFQQMEVAETRIQAFESIKDAQQALDTFPDDDQLLAQLKLIKESVVEHESLMEKLTKHQDSIQIILMKGNAILEMVSIDNTDQFKISIKDKLKIITNKWNDLYNHSIEFQRQLHKSLYNIQMSFLIKIEDSIDQLEKIRRDQTHFGNNIEELKEQLKINRSMEMRIESTEKFISHLKTFLVYSEDSDHSESEEEAAVKNDDQIKRVSKSITDSSFEERLQSIGKQWNDLVSWVSSRYSSLQKTLLSWRHFEDEIQEILDWLEERKCTADQFLRKSSRNEFNGFVNFTEGKWLKMLSNFDKSGKKLKDSCNGELSVIEIVVAKRNQIVQEWTDASEKWRDSLDNWTGADSKQKSTRAASCSDMSLANCSKRRNMQQDTKNIPASQSDMNINAFPVQAGYKTKFENDVEQMMSWLENSAEKLELITLESISPEERPPIEEQRKSIDILSNEINRMKLKKSMEQIKKLGQIYQEDLNKHGENTDEIEQLFEELDERWSYLENQLVKGRQKVLSLEISSQLEQESHWIENDIKLTVEFLQSVDYNTNVAGIEKLIKNANELRNRFLEKKNFLKQFTDNYQVVKCDLSRLNEEIFTKQITDLNQKVINQLQIIEHEQIKMRNTLTIMEMDLLETENLIKELSNTINEKLTIDSFDKLENESIKYRDLLIKYENQLELLNKIPTPDSSSRRYKVLFEMQKSFKSVGVRLEKRISFLKDLSERSLQWKNQTIEFDRWLDEVGSYLDECEHQEYTETDIIIETIKETEAGIEDMENLIPTLKNIEISTVNLEAYFEKDLRLEMHLKKNDLQKKWDTLHQRYLTFKNYLQNVMNKPNIPVNPKMKVTPQQVAIIVESDSRTEDSLIDIDMEHSNFSTESLDKPEELINQSRNTDSEESRDQKVISEILDWIEVSTDALGQYTNIDNIEQLNTFGQMVMEMQNSKQAYIEKLKEINSTPAYDHVNENCYKFCDFLDSEYQRYKESEYHLKDVKSILSDEDKWLGKVDRVMQQSLSCDHLDVEKLSENIDEIERVVCDHSEEDFNRLEDLKFSLMNARVLERSVSMEIEQIKEKSVIIKNKANLRLGSLQQLLEHVQSVEKRVTQMTVWIDDTSNLLKSRITADLLGADMPEEFEILKLNFSEWEKFLVELEDLEKGKLYQGKKETSERFRLQRLKLQKSFRPLKDLFSRYSRPADFEPRLDNLKREVNRVAEHIYLLDIISISPEDLENCQTQAKKFKESLISSDADLKYVYDLGKILAERKEIEFPERFSQQLDGLKKRYYNLLEQISEAEEKLTAAKTLIEEIFEKESQIDEILENPEDNKENLLNFDSNIISIITDRAEKLKTYTDYENSALVKEMFDDLKEKCDRILKKKEEAINKKRVVIESPDQLNIPTDQSIFETDQTPPISDEQTIEGKLDSLYSKTNQIRQVASQIVSTEELQKKQEEINKYPIFQDKLEQLFSSISTHQITNGHIEEEEEEDHKISGKEVLEENILSTSASSLHNELEISTLKSRENSFGDSLSSPYSVEDMSGNENAVSDLSYSVQAAKIEKNILHQVTVEIKDHIHSFIVFCQNNLGSGMSLTGSSSKPITTLNELKFKVNCVKETITEIFKEQRFYIDHRLRELSAYADTSDQLEELDRIQRYWLESIGKLNKRISRLADLNKRIEDVEANLREYELQPSEKLRIKALRFISQIEEELNVNLQKDRLRLTSCGRLGNQDINITKSNSNNSVSQLLNQEIINSQENYRENLKTVREQLKEIGRRLNTVRIYIDDSRRGCLSKLADRIQDIDDKLADCSHMLAEVQYNMASGIEHQNNDTINLNFLIEAQKKRLGKYHNEFQTHLNKWMENASRWQEFVEKLEKIQNDLQMIEQELVSVENGAGCSAQEMSEIKKNLSGFEKKMVLLEQDGDNLSMSCNDTDADFLRDRLSDLRSRYTICLQMNRQPNVQKTDEKDNLKDDSFDQYYLENNTDITIQEKISNNYNELKQSQSSELDLNANSVHSSQDSLPNDDYETTSGDSSEELSTMIDGAATVLAGNLSSWVNLTSETISQISTNDFDSIGELEDKITEITKVKKEALERMAQISICLDKHSSSESNSITAELSSQITDESNSQLLVKYQDLKNIIYLKTNELSEIKVQYHHIQDQLKRLENIFDEIKHLQNYQISEQLLERIKTHYTDSDIRLLEELINKIPNGLRQSLDIRFDNLQPIIQEIQARFFEAKERTVGEEEYSPDSQKTQEKINQIALLLKSINTFMVNSKVNLGLLDDIEGCLEHIRAFDSRLEEHKFILQSILENKSTHSNLISDLTFSETVEKVDRLWNSTKIKLKERENELLNMHQLKEKLDESEISLRQWMEESEEKLNKLLTEGLSSRNQKILDVVKTGIPNWQQTMNEYQSMSYELTNSYPNHNSQELENNLEQMNKQWSAIMNKLAQCTRELNLIRSPQEQNNYGNEVATEKSLLTTNEINSGISIEKLSGWLSSLEGQLETIEMGIVRWRSGSGLIATGNTDKLKSKLINQLNELQNEIGSYKSQFQLCSESEKNDSEYQISKRWKTLNEKTNELRQSMEGTMESSQNLLTKLRLLNDWLAHKEADMLEQKGNQCNTFVLAQNQLIKFENFMSDIEAHRSQIEDSIEQAQNQIGESIEPNKAEHSHSLNLESEGESDNSDTGSNGNVPDDKSKRLNRRLRRHSHYMKRKWIELNLKMRDFYEYLKKKTNLLKSVDIQIKECNQLLSELEFHIDNWTNIANIKLVLISQEMAQTKSLLQSALPVTEKVSSMDSQLQSLKIPNTDEIFKELEKINSRITAIKSLCEMRLKQLHQQEVLSIKQASNTEEAQIPMFQESSNTIPRKTDLPIGISENRKFIELENESVSYPWERCLHPSGSEVPYYKNHSTQDTQWDHPIMADLIKSFDELNSIRFSAYRTAMKLRALQKILCLDFIDLNIVIETFRLCGIQSASVNERLLDVGQIIVFLASLYRAANQRMVKGKDGSNLIVNQEPDKMSHSILGCARGSSIRHSRSKVKSHHTRSNSFGGFRNDNEKDDMGSKSSCLKSPTKTPSSQAAIMKCSGMANIPSTRTQLSTGEYEINVPVCVDLALNWLLNVYDSARNGKIRVLSLKAAIVILTNSSLEEKYKYMFTLVCNSQNQMDSPRLTNLLTDCILIPKHLNEASSFGVESVKPSVNSCFKNSTESGNHRYIRLSHFLAWLRLEPQTLVWLPVLNRIISAESAVHQAKCGVCKIQPIVGLRYRCLRCLNFDLCQACFFYSKTSKSHKVSHPMQEYCNVTSSRENFRDYSRIFRNRFRSKSHIRRQTKLSYLPVQNGSNLDNTDAKNQSTPEGNPEMMSTNHQIHSRVEQYANRLAEVEQLNKSNMIPKSGIIEQKYEPLLLSQDFNGEYRNKNRQDEEHQIIFQHTEALRKHQRNKSLTVNNNMHGTLQTQRSLETALSNLQSVPQLKSNTNVQYSVPQSQMSAGIKRYPFESDNLNQVNLSNSGVSSSDDLRVRNSNSSLNQVIHGLENQKRQLMAEYERLQLHTPSNNINSGMSPMLSTENSSRYASVDFGFPQGTRTLPYNQSIPPPSMRKTNRTLMSPNTTSLERPGTYLPPSEDLVTEARMLRQHKGRLEARMGMLEQHNRHLEAQLSRLRQLIDESPNNPNNFLPSTNLINSFVPNAMNLDQETEMLTAAQYAAAKRINEISSLSPIYNNSLRFQGNPGNDLLSKNYQNPSSIYSGTRSTPVQNFYGSLERSSSYRGAQDTTPVGFNYRAPVDRPAQPALTPVTYAPSHQLKASSETGGSLSESEFQMMCRSLADSCPAVTLATVHGQSTNSIGSLFYMAGQVGQAVGQLVNVMTDDFNNNQDGESPGSKTPTINTNKSSKPTLNEDFVLPTSSSIINHSAKTNSKYN